MGIAQDARNAFQEKDIHAAIYHLRTALEFFMKQATENKPSDKIEGATLCEDYKKTLSDDLKKIAGFPSLTDLYSRLSAKAHDRSGNAEDFENAWKKFENLLELLDVYNKMNPNE